MKNMISSFSGVIDAASESLGAAALARRGKISLSQSDMACLIAKAYRTMCLSRTGSFIDDDDTRRNIRAVAKWLTEPSTKTSLLMWGRCGNGKSTMNSAVKDVIVSLRTIHLKYDFRIVNDEERTQAKELMSSLPSIGMTTATNLCYMAEREPERFHATCGMELLAVDDAGSEPMTVKRYGTQTNPFTEMLFHRYENMLPTVITTNLSPEKIGYVYGERISDRIKEMCNIIEFKHESYRK